jgi:hypothetical protein
MKIIAMLFLFTIGCSNSNWVGMVIEEETQFVNDTTVLVYKVYESKDTLKWFANCISIERDKAVYKLKMGIDMNQYNWAEQKRYFEGDLSKIKIKSIHSEWARKNKKSRKTPRFT